MSQNLPRALHLKVITPRKLLVETEVEEISLPSLEGYLGILPGHRPLLIALGKGTVTYKLAKKEGKVPVQGGYAEILPESVVIFTELSKDEANQSPEG